MTSTMLRSGLLATYASLFFGVGIASAETIIKLNLGSTGPDVQLIDSGAGMFLSSVDDGAAATPGDQETATTFHGFVSTNGVADILTGSSFTLSDVEMSGPPTGGALVSQPTTGGSFSVFDAAGNLLLEGELSAGSIVGTSGSSATGAFLTANVGSFTGPTDAALNQVYKLLEPGSASLAISLTDVISISDTGSPIAGLGIGADGNLLDFTADATANIGAEPSLDILPEPTASTLLLFGMLGVLGFRRRGA